MSANRIVFVKLGIGELTHDRIKKASMKNVCTFHLVKSILLQWVQCKYTGIKLLNKKISILYAITEKTFNIIAKNYHAQSLCFI